MQINNKTKKTIIATHAHEAKSLSAQTIGMLKYKTPHALIIITRFGIHTFFMKYAIDVLVLNSQNKVVAMKKNMHPHQIFFWHPRYRSIIELPNNTITRTRTTLGDQIDFRKM